MASITDMTEYVNISKLSEYNETITIEIPSTFSSIWDSIMLIFAKYTILQWSTSLILFISIFIILRYLDAQEFVEFTNTQIIMLSSLIVIVFYFILLIIGVFTILQPLELMFLIWLSTLLMIITGKRN